MGMFGKRKQAVLEELANRPLMSPNVTQFMEKLGLSDEDIADMANTSSTVDPVQATLDQGGAALNTFVNSTNTTWSQSMGARIDLQPYQMLPAVCWEFDDKHDHTLLVDVMGLLPTNPWNIVLLAMNDDTATLTGAGRFPMTITEEAVTATSLAKISIVEELETVKKHAQAPDFVAVRDGAIARIIAMARPVGSALLGQHVVDHSRRTFFGD